MASNRRRFRHEVAAGKVDPTMGRLMGEAARHFAELSVDARAIMVGPHLRRADGSVGVYVVFTHPEATAHAAWAMLMPPMPAGALTERQQTYVADQAHAEFLRGLRKLFGEVVEYRTSAGLADAAVAKHPCARTIAFRGNPGDVFAGTIVEFIEH
jgi:hypothetical protein